MGLANFVKQVDYSCSLMAKKYSLLYMLEYKDWMETLKEWDADFEKFF